MSTKYFNSKEEEEKWRKHWEKQRVFSSNPNDKESYSIVMPPPNITGILHMGHMLNATVQDTLIRKARMSGKNACWVPGSDHASIATESKVVSLLKEKGLSKQKIGREKFLSNAFEWKNKYGSIIYSQLKKLGVSCDWDRTAFTMDEDMSEYVTEAFIKLYEKQFIYKDWKIVNWDPLAKTTLSNEEVIRKEQQSELYYINYKIEGTKEFLTIATTRPETIMGDTAVCVHPKDERYKKFIGKKVVVPIIKKVVPIIADNYIDREFGTGVLKVTPAHDANDYEIGKKHSLPIIDIFDNAGKLNEKAKVFVGTDRFKARKLIIEELKKEKTLTKTEIITNNIGYSERNPDTIVEPKLSLQWFLKMKTLAEPALKNVLNDEIKFYPKKYKNVYRHWLENIRDWPISRQLWWGHRIPAYYFGENKQFVVAKTKEQALKKAQKLANNTSLSLNDLKQDEDVLDTWFSSWLWPISVFHGFKKNKEDFNYYYPTSVLVTGWDIIFFWVARMIMAGYFFSEKPPFKAVYFTGMVRDEKGRKMSKSLGNSPDAENLIEEYGADGVRFGMLSCAPAGNDLLFNEALCEQGKNFINKIYNSFKLIKGWVSNDNPPSEEENLSIKWFESKLASKSEELDRLFENYKLSEALMLVYKLIWDDFCSWYLESIKPKYQETISEETLAKTIFFFEGLMKLLHPFMPFVTESLWQLIKKRAVNDTISTLNGSQYAKQEKLENSFQELKNITNKIRLFRKEKGIHFKEELTLKTKKTALPDKLFPILCKLNHINLTICKTNPENAEVIISGTNKYFITSDKVAKATPAKNKTKISEDINYLKGFLASIDKKLSNKKFVENAPKQVIENELKKKSDTEKKINMLSEQLNS